MAGPMVGPLLEAARPRPRHRLLDAGRRVSRPRAQPAAAREPRVHHAQGRRGGRGPRHRLGRRRRPLLLHRRHRPRSSTATSSPRCSPSRCCARAPGEAILYDVRASRAVADTVERGRRHGAPQPRRPRVLQDAHARRGRDVRRRGLRPLLLPRLLLRRQRHDPGAADPRAAQRRGRQALDAAGPLPLDVLHLRRDQLDRRGRAGEARRDRGSATPTRRSATSTASRSTTTTGTSTCAPRTPSRSCASAWSRWSPCEDMERRRDEVLDIIRS